MFNWAKQQLANVAGTQEPIYGPSAIQSVENQAKETPYTEVTKEAQKWTVMDSTCVETQTFYIMTDSGHIAMAQVIYSNVMGVRTTCQFNAKIQYMDGKTPQLWSSDPLENYGFDADKYSFFADGVSLELSEDGSSYTIKSAVNENSMVNLKFSRVAPGFVVGKNGTSYFGTDPKNPWGSMRHVFWPRCTVEGSFITKAGEVKMDGKGLFIHALQGMKPHHAAARWNFVNFQSPDYSAVLMQFTTPPSYGSTVVNVGGVVKGNELLFAGASCSVTHTEVKGDPDNDWPEPGSIAYHWEGKTKDGQDATTDLAGSLGSRIDRVDVMAEVPGFVKTIVASAVGTKPYIYQYAPKLTLKGKIGSTEFEQEGATFIEATFIS